MGLGESEALERQNVAPKYSRPQFASFYIISFQINCQFEAFIIFSTLAGVHQAIEVPEIFLSKQK